MATRFLPSLARLIRSSSVNQKRDDSYHGNRFYLINTIGTMTTKYVHSRHTIYVWLGYFTVQIIKDLTIIL